MLSDVEAIEFPEQTDDILTDYWYDDSDEDDVRADSEMQNLLVVDDQNLAYPIPVPHDETLIDSAALIILVLEKNVSAIGFNLIMSVMMVSSMMSYNW